MMYRSIGALAEAIENIEDDHIRFIARVVMRDAYRHGLREVNNANTFKKKFHQERVEIILKEKSEGIINNNINNN